MPKRPRTEANDPFKQPAYLKRFLCYHDWSRAELSTLSCVSKSWRKHCQGILFGASAAVLRPTSLIRCSAAQVHLPRRQARLRRVSCMPVLQSSHLPQNDRLSAKEDAPRRNLHCHRPQLQEPLWPGHIWRHRRIHPSVGYPWTRIDRVSDLPQLRAKATRDLQRPGVCPSLFRSPHSLADYGRSCDYLYEGGNDSHRTDELDRTWPLSSPPRRSSSPSRPA
jgi:hypothetical protein